MGLRQLAQTRRPSGGVGRPPSASLRPRSAHGSRPGARRRTISRRFRPQNRLRQGRGAIVAGPSDHPTAERICADRSCRLAGPRDRWQPCGGQGSSHAAQDAADQRRPLLRCINPADGSAASRRLWHEAGVLVECFSSRCPILRALCRHGLRSRHGALSRAGARPWSTGRAASDLVGPQLAAHANLRGRGLVRGPGVTAVPMSKGRRIHPRLE